MLEKEIQKTILSYLKLKGYFVWKNNTTGIYKKSTDSYIPSPAVGSPDIFIVIDGKIIGIEVKRDGGRQSLDQQNWQYNFEKAGGRYILARSLDDVINHGL